LNQRPRLLALKAAIVARGLTHRQVASALHWHPSHFSRVIAGTKAMPDWAWSRLAEMLDVPEEAIRPRLDPKPQAVAA
jgi:plasmid maintenance system antidote protein VapI